MHMGLTTSGIFFKCRLRVGPSGVGPEFCIYDQAPGDTEVAIPQTELWVQGHRALQSCWEATVSCGPTEVCGALKHSVDLNWSG